MKMRSTTCCIVRQSGRHFSLRCCASGRVLAALLIALAIGASVVSAQTVAKRQFDAASIKPSTSQRIMTVRPLPGRLSADASLQVLIQYAYGVEPFQIVGGPNWLSSNRYQIDATAGTAATRDQVFLMLQSLLEDRFQLKTHRETKDLQVFALVPNKASLNLQPPQEGGCVDSPANATADWTGAGRLAAPGEGSSVQGQCGTALVVLGPKGAQIRGGKVSMSELARVLSTLVGRSVVDRTGFSGVFDVELNFVPDDTTPSLPPPPPNSGISDMTGVSIAQALQQQLGLRLQSTKGPVQVIVVDQAEPPSAN